jgi:thioesterase domain-containing protein
MAAYYVKNLLAFQPHGPYVLAGHSSGGQVAFEMAQTLLKRGQKVALLALFDTGAVSNELAQRREEIRNQDDAMLLAEVLQQNLPLSLEHLQRLNSEERFLYIIELAKQHNLIPPDFQLAQATLFLRTLRANLAASADYVPEKYPGRIILFRASERVIPAIPHGDTLGWGSVATGAVELHVVPGNHLNMMVQPNVQVVADLLRTSLEKVRRGE